MSIEDQVIDFYYKLFDRTFSQGFQLQGVGRLKRDAVTRQVEDSAGAASQSLTRLFENQQLTEHEAADILAGFGPLAGLVKLADIDNPQVTPEALVEKLLPGLPLPGAVERARHDALYRVALHSTAQVLMLVGPVMVEWEKLRFSSTFELPRRVVSRLNRISEQLDEIGRSGEAAADERYELSYRDYLLQRFHRVEAGTVKMTTNLDVDLRELFVMSRVLPRKSGAGSDGEAGEATLMTLAAAREFLGVEPEVGLVAASPKDDPEEAGNAALDQVRSYPRNVIVGAPGSGKSTFLEWLQVKLAAAEEELVMGGGQAIPLLLRVRQLDAKKLPSGASLIERATASGDRAALMPQGWIERQMKAGRVIFMLDGLDETEPKLRDRYVLPWLGELCQQYPDCRFVVSSRPVGYESGTLRALEFVECALLDFNDEEISEYTRNWCTAVRLARNEPEEEARSEGAADGGQIVDGFKDHPFIRNLARNPLMISAICLVHYFESGNLPTDRSLLYKLCVEGLLHHWDQRRGIHSEFGLEEKLRACREVALAMQADDRAEYDAAKVRKCFTKVLGDRARAMKLLEHIRYRTGLLLERRPGVFAFAHLTFQEYLAALGVYKGQRPDIDAERLAREHDDSRWQEVIALYSGLASTPAARTMVEQLVAQPDTDSLSEVLTEAYLSAGPPLVDDRALRRAVFKRIAAAPSRRKDSLSRFAADEVAPIAHLYAGQTGGGPSSGAHLWLNAHPDSIDFGVIGERLREWRRLPPGGASELIHLLHAYAPGALLAEFATDAAMYAEPTLPKTQGFPLAEWALMGLFNRAVRGSRASMGAEASLLQILRTLADQKSFGVAVITLPQVLAGKTGLAVRSRSVSTRVEFASLARRVAKRFRKLPKDDLLRSARDKPIRALNSWADSLEPGSSRKKTPETKRKAASKRSARKRPEKGAK